MPSFLLHVGVSPYNKSPLPLANPCFGGNNSFIFVPWCTGTDADRAPNQIEYRYLTHPTGVREFLQLHPEFGNRAIDFKTQNNPDFVKYTFSEWLRIQGPDKVDRGAARTARLFPKMQIGSKVYFAASFMKIKDIPSIQEFVTAPEKYKESIKTCFSKHSYSHSLSGFIGVFANLTIEEKIGTDEYLKLDSDANRKSSSNWNTLCSRDVLIKGSANGSRCWDKVVPIGIGNYPIDEFKALFSEGRIVKWSGWFDEEAAGLLDRFLGVS
ncbi:MAG: hypothetical protein ABSD42_09175 [Candidatus Bathyarchaeia archaeon]